MTTSQYFLLVAMVALALLALCSAAETVYHWMVNKRPAWVWFAAFTSGMVFASLSGAGAIAIAIEVARR